MYTYYVYTYIYIYDNLGTGCEVRKERFYTPPPPGSNFRDCKRVGIETKAYIHHPLWVVVVVVRRIGLPNNL